MAQESRRQRTQHSEAGGLERFGQNKHCQDTDGVLDAKHHCDPAAVHGNEK